MDIQLKPVHEQVIVITGATSGIGLATVEAAARQGAKLVLAARSEDTLQEIVEQINDSGGEAIYVAGDVAEHETHEKIAEAAVSRFGRIDTWVNNAGVSIYGRLDQVSEEDSRRLFDTNFWGVVHGSVVALKHLRAGGGALINLGSEVSDAVVPLQGMYSASKHAVKGFTDALRIEIEDVDKAPISITLVQPTAVNTPYPQHARNYMDQEPKLPSPMIEPRQVADAILGAAAEPRRSVKVGMMSKINTMVAHMIPPLADHMAARIVDQQHYDAPPRNPEGALHKPGGTGQVHGQAPQQQATEAQPTPRTPPTRPELTLPTREEREREREARDKAEREAREAREARQRQAQPAQSDQKAQAPDNQKAQAPAEKQLALPSADAEQKQLPPAEDETASREQTLQPSVSDEGRMSEGATAPSVPLREAGGLDAEQPAAAQRTVAAAPAAAPASAHHLS